MSKLGLGPGGPSVFPSFPTEKRTINNMGWTDLGGSVHGYPTAIGLAGFPTIFAFATDPSLNHALWVCALDLLTMTGSW